MSDVSREIPFKVDMAGVIEILGGSLYSRRDVALRELIQNAHDAIQRRRAVELSFQGAIVVSLDAEANTLSVADDGVGITEDEAEAYLGTLGAGISGWLKRTAPEDARATRVIGQFGVGLFSAFLLAERIVVVSRKSPDDAPIRWEAGQGASIRLGPGERAEQGTTITLHLRAEHAAWSQEPRHVREAVRHYADFLPVPIKLAGSARRLNVQSPSWFEPAPDPDVLSMELEQRFDDAPLDVLHLRREDPTVQGAVFITPNRTPGFSGRALVTATCRRMVISTRVDGLFPEWGSFYRGVLELPELQPTTSREEFIRDERFERTKATLERALFERLRTLEREDPQRLRSIVTWHRYAFAGAALDVPELRALLRTSYPFATTHGPLSFAEVSERAGERPIWFNPDRHLEGWCRRAFGGSRTPCVQALRTFETTLLTLLAADQGERPREVEVATPKNPRFLSEVLGLQRLEEVDPSWEEFFAALEARVRVANMDSAEAVLAFPARGAELRRDLEGLTSDGSVPAAFAGMIQRHLDESADDRDEVILNRGHALVKRALSGSVHAPLASVLRVLVHDGLRSAGVEVPAEGREAARADLDWIAETVAKGTP